MSPAPEVSHTIELAKLAIRYRRAIGVNLSEPAKRMAGHAQRILLDAGITYWIEAAPTGETSITCVRCCMTSHNPNDIEQRYCAVCHVFHGT